MGETRVDLHHLLEDLRDAYPFSLEETILTEIIANSLDSGADRIAIAADPAQGALTAVDNGSGMQRAEMRRYHDIAASAKLRGHGIGFAGVGIKLGLLVCEEVTTETKRGKTHIASRWHLASRHRAPWNWISPPGFVGDRGTAVRLKLGNPLSPLVDQGFIEGIIRRHFQPLLDPAFETLLASHYPGGIGFQVNGRRLERHRASDREQAHLIIRLGRKRKPSAIGYLLRVSGALPEDERGLAISTLGKVIRRGWDWLGVTPAMQDRVGGLIEVPDLAATLTLNKGDFIRTGARGAVYLAYRKAIQEAVSRQLELWGDQRGTASDASSRMVRPLERDLDRVLEELSDDFPLLASLIDRKVGGQKRLPLAAVKSEGESNTPALTATPLSAEVLTDEETGPDDSLAIPPSAERRATDTDASPTPPSPPTPSFSPLPAENRTRKPMRYGLGIQFEHRPEDPELGRLVESTVRINEAHPAYRRAMASRSAGYHISLAVGLALASLAVEPAQEHAFLTKFLAHWGQALDESGKASRRRSRGTE
jgi:hypothetical protein